MWRLCCSLALTWLVCASAPQSSAENVVLNRADFRDQVYACWLGKNIGGTLGTPLEGRREMHSLTFYDPTPTTPAANDDLDLQLLWLKALEDRAGPLTDRDDEPAVTARDLARYWQKYVPVDWNEYGIGKANVRKGFEPPLSGQFDNVWRDSNGAWIRSEIWACLAPGCPSLAARYAWEDACVDHGANEGTWAELFTASLESAAFVEHDRDRLLAIALSYVPPGSGVAKAVRAAMDARRRGLELKAAREAVVEATAATGWFMAPRNVAFTVLGWLYGEDDFGKSLCAAVNCGDDTDCTGATLGALWGILHGTAGIPERWRAPVGETIRNVAIAGFRPPATIAELTDRTVRMAERVLAAHHAGVSLGAVASHDPAARLRLVDARVARELWTRSPYRVTGRTSSVRADLDYRSDPLCQPGRPVAVGVALQNRTGSPMTVTVTWSGTVGVLRFEPRVARVRLPARGAAQHAFRVIATEAARDAGGLQGTLSVCPEGQPALGIPFALALRPGVHPADLALATRGASATSDSELDRESGCTARVVDGVIASPSAFEGKRWHSALTPHPHWVAVHLPTPARVGRVIVHFADPAGHPVDFDCQASDDGSTWTTLATRSGWTDARSFDCHLEQPAALRHFRFLIRRSASSQWPGAAQVSEIELLPP